MNFSYWMVLGACVLLAAPLDGSSVPFRAGGNSMRLPPGQLAPPVEAPGPVLPGTAASYRRAREVLARARLVTGGPHDIAARGGLTVEAVGTLNKGAEYQGRTPSSLDPGRFEETLVLGAAVGRVAYAYREERYDGTFEAVREIYPGGDERQIVLPASRQVIVLRSPDHEAGRTKLTRRIPAALLAEVATRPASLRWLGRAGPDERIAATLASGDTLTLVFDSDAGVLTRVEYLADVQGFGDTEVAWHFDEYAPLEGVGAFPRRYGVSVAGRPFTDMRVTRLGPADAGSLSAPDDYCVVTPPSAASGGDASSGAEVQEIVPGVRRVTRLRQGFHPLFVEFADFVVAFDAPAGYALLNELPAGDVAPGPSSAWLSERYIALIKQAVPDKPIRYVVLTHFHNDHAGGVRAFIAEGATVVALPDTAAWVRKLVDAPHTLAPDRYSTAPRPLQMEVVTGRNVITDGQRRLEVIDVGDNPHGDGMLIGHLPAERLMFVSDLVEPVAVERYPTASHAALDRFFGAWLEREGLAPDRVYTMHGAGLATPAHLDRLRTVRPD